MLRICKQITTQKEHTKKQLFHFKNLIVLNQPYKFCRNSTSRTRVIKVTSTLMIYYLYKVIIKPNHSKYRHLVFYKHRKTETPLSVQIVFNKNKHLNLYY